MNQYRKQMPSSETVFNRNAVHIFANVWHYEI